MNNNVYVQEVLVLWTKASRGAPASAVRNSLPKASSIAEDELHQLQDGDGFSSITMSEWQDFQVNQSIQIFRDFNRYKWPSLSIKFLNSNVVVAWYKHSFHSLGAPDRSECKAVSHDLESDKLLRVTFNSRDSHPTGEWHYRLTTYNVLMTTTPSTSMFMANPTKCISDLADLW